MKHNQSWDLIALPGGMPGAEHLRDCAALISLLEKQKADGNFTPQCAQHQLLCLQARFGRRWGYVLSSSWTKRKDVISCG
ncbi:hypothetical protein QTG54_005234 [Skeletonema marinoi]|uniref:Uncharacterized protein n=1 Tax=Skeletonema marinoi TaxID=267567 RepID=A0AAD9DDS9_9STRA|nr:hypothetical protein QTG54_005234 [Skeletonema marinoi]